MDTVSFLTARLNREALRYAAGRQMFCPCCERVLDCTDTVFAQDHSGKGAVLILCGACWGRAPWSGRSGALEVLDGRTLYAPRKRAQQWVAKV